LALSGEYDLTVGVRCRCGLMSNYCDHLLLLSKRRGRRPDQKHYRHGNVGRSSFSRNPNSVDLHLAGSQRWII